MLNEEDIRKKPEVVLEEHKTDYEIEGIKEDYARYCDEIMGATPPYRIITWPLKALGGLLLFVGLLTIIFGPRYVTYDVLSGPSLFQVFQLYPGPIASVGSVIFGAAAWIDSTGYEKIMSPEDFLRLRYVLVAAEGSAPVDNILIQHVEGEIFQIIRVESPAVAEVGTV